MTPGNSLAEHQLSRMSKLSRLLNSYMVTVQMFFTDALLTSEKTTVRRGTFQSNAPDHRWK